MSDLDPAIWRPVSIAPMPLLAELREAVLARSTKRMPKWKFRAAPDVVMQIQPKPATITKRNLFGWPWFECHAVVRDEVTVAMLMDRPSDGWEIRFRLFIDRDGLWWFNVNGVGYCDGWRSDEPMVIRDCLVDLLPVAFARLRPEMMLKPSCLMCGKMLSDPVSMARWIGPECAGTTSRAVPYTFMLATA